MAYVKIYPRENGRFKGLGQKCHFCGGEITTEDLKDGRGVIAKKTTTLSPVHYYHKACGLRIGLEFD